MSTCLPASIACLAAAKWRSSGVATQTKSTPASMARFTPSGPSKLVKSAMRPRALCL